MYTCELDTCRSKATIKCFECEDIFCRAHVTDCSACGCSFCHDADCVHQSIRCQEIKQQLAQGQTPTPRKQRRLPTLPTTAGSKPRRSLPPTPTGASSLLAESQIACTQCHQKYPISQLKDNRCIPCVTIEQTTLESEHCAQCQKSPAPNERFCAMCLAGYKRMQKDERVLHVLLSKLKVNKATTSAFFLLITLPIIKKTDKTDFNDYYLHQLLAIELYLYPYQQSDPTIRTAKLFSPSPINQQAITDGCATLMDLHQAYQTYFSEQKLIGDINALLSRQQKILSMLNPVLQQHITSLPNKPNGVISHTIEILVQTKPLPAATAQAPIFRINHAHLLALTLLLLLNREGISAGLVTLLEECIPYIVLSYSVELKQSAGIQPLSQLALEYQG